MLKIRALTSTFEEYTSHLVSDAGEVAFPHGNREFNCDHQMTVYLLALFYFVAQRIDPWAWFTMGKCSISEL